MTKCSLGQGNARVPASSVLCSAMNELTLGGDLLDKIEFVPIPGQNGYSCFRRRQEDEGIIQAFLTLMALQALNPRERTGNHAGIGPDMRVGFQQPAFRYVCE